MKIYFVNAVYLSLIELVAERSVVSGRLEELEVLKKETVEILSEKLIDSENCEKIKSKVNELINWITKKFQDIFKNYQSKLNFLLSKSIIKICMNFTLRR